MTLSTPAIPTLTAISNRSSVSPSISVETLSPQTPMQITTYKKQAETAVEAGDFAESSRLGALALTLESQLFCKQANINQQLVVFSLFGNDPLYCETAIFNAQAMPEVYPNWQMRVYHDETVPAHVLKRLEAHQVQLVNVNDIGIRHWPGTFWRFFAATDAQVARVLFRDADSIIDAREASWVKVWLDSDKPFHVMRDWYSHTDLILAGLWGAYTPFLLGINSWIEAYVQVGNLHPTHADQHFLAQVVWPKIKPFCLVHDTVHQIDWNTAIDSPKAGSHSSDAMGGFKAKMMTVSVPTEVKQYQVLLTDQDGAVVMQYIRQPKDGQDVYHLPERYWQNTQTAGWKLVHAPIVVPQFTVTKVGVQEEK